MKATPTHRAAIYLRVSLDSTGEMLAVDRQRDDCRAICSARGWEVVGEYVDNSVSASSSTVQRPGYDGLVDAYDRGEFDALVCWDLDRLTRQPRQLEDWIDAAEKRGLLLVTANGEADLTTDGGRMFARVKSAVARSEIERKSARQTRAARQRADRGMPPKGVRLTGYDTSGGVIEHEADVVRRIFAAFAAGETIRGIARELEASGTPTRSGAAWNPSSIRTILTNPRYAGLAVYKGEALDRPGQWPAIIDQGTFALVRARINDPARLTHRKGYDRRYLGSGLYVCGECDHRMRAWSGARYRCANACFGRSGPPVDAYVRAVIAERLRRADARDLLAPPAVDPSPLHAQAEGLRHRLAAIAADYDAGRIDGVRYSSATAATSDELRDVERQLVNVTAGATVADVLDGDDPGEAFLVAPLSRQRAILDALVTVRLSPGVHGSRTFRPESVLIEWKANA